MAPLLRRAKPGAFRGRTERRLMRENTILRKMRDGGTSVGSWVGFESPLSTEIMAMAGFEWLMIDGEHGPITGETVIHLINATRAAGAVPFVRVVWNEPALIQQALDFGAYGVLVPMVNSRADAQAAAADAKYPPLGRRSRGGSRAPVVFGTEMGTYGPRANEETMLMVQLETVEAFEAAEQIASVDGVDLLFVGPADLALSMGEWPLNWAKASERYKEAIASAPRIAKAHGKFAGVLAYEPAFAADCLRFGYQFVGYSADTALLQKAARAARAEVKA
jgi:4-hydroxy-2-oxoheptanedioate aldolase